MQIIPGYDYLGDHHNRSFKRLNDSFIIEDCTNGEACAYLHFAPEEEIELVGNGIKGKDFRIVFEGAQILQLIKNGMLLNLIKGFKIMLFVFNLTKSY